MILDIWSKYGKSVILPAIICAGVIFYFLLAKEPQSPEPIVLSAASEQPSEQSQPIEQHNEADALPEPTSIQVDVKGAVKHPGVYPFTTDDRIIDAINAAGGYVNEADTRFINHAQKLTDELVIYVPKKGEEIEQAPTVVTSPAAASSSANGQSALVNINTANESELTTLPGIGPSKAAAIIAYRDENGSFQTIEDLTEVSGIGDKTFERLQPLITVK